MATFRERPYTAANFLVDLGTGDTESVQAGFAEVVIPEAALGVITYRSGNEKEGAPRKLPGLTRYGNVTLKRGVLGSLDLFEWWSQARSGDPNVRRTVRVSLLSEDRSEVALTWTLRNAWPVSWRVSDLSAEGQGVAMEIVELAYERLDVE